MLLCSAAGLWLSVLFRTSSRISPIPRMSSSSTSNVEAVIFRCTVKQWKTLFLAYLQFSLDLK
ncbi:hypothetical protein Bca4012_092056 [Brassica carinata]|uniref:Secreted protein n=1 Tax=Brassica oleracea TaxID=3712 RepID=A0A3P6G2A4_BRAOL|nr:unnamed protein product [Brassica oleracea]